MSEWVCMLLDRPAAAVSCAWGTAVGQGGRHGRSRANCGIRCARWQPSGRDLADTEGLCWVWLLAPAAQCSPCNRTVDWQATSFTPGMATLASVWYGTSYQLVTRSHWKECWKELLGLGFLAIFLENSWTRIIGNLTYIVMQWKLH